MITSFSIGNFKAFQETQRIPLKPITLIYGANSSGKSSIIHALMLAQHVQETGDFDVLNSVKGGDSIDFGGFQQYIYGHNTSNKMEISFQMMLPRKKQLTTVNVLIGMPLDDLGRRMQSASPEVIRYDILHGENHILRISPRKDGKLGIDHQDSSLLKAPRKLGFVINGKPIESTVPLEKLREVSEKYQLERRGLLPSGTTDIGKVLHRIFGLKTSSDIRKVDEDDIALFQIADLLTDVIRPIELEVGKYLRSLQYLGPLRCYPSRHMIMSRYNDPNWYAGGGQAWEIIRKNDVVRSRLNEWLNSEDRLHTPYKLVLREFVDIDQLDKPISDAFETAKIGFEVEYDRDGAVSGSPIIENIEEEVDKFRDSIRSSDEIEKWRELNLIDRRSDTVVSHRDIGVGVSQVLPILAYTYAFRKSVIAIEQPEIHLHPALQADLGDVFIESALGTNKNNLLIETHSEHLLLRIMKRIRQASQDALPTGIPQISPDDVCVLFVQPNGTFSIVDEIKISKQGTLKNTWPGGFFEEDIREIF